MPSCFQDEISHPLPFLVRSQIGQAREVAFTRVAELTAGCSTQTGGWSVAQSISPSMKSNVSFPTSGAFQCSIPQHLFCGHTSSRSHTLCSSRCHRKRVRNGINRPKAKRMRSSTSSSDSSRASRFPNTSITRRESDNKPLGISRSS